MRKLQFLVVGAGHIGNRHAKMIQQQEEAELVALVETNIIAKEECKLNFPNTPVYDSIFTAIEVHPEIELVNICTPNGLHMEHAKQAIELDKHVVVEKPMGLITAECEEVLNLALQHNKQVFIVMQNRYSPPSKWLKEVVSKHLLGDLYKVSINCFWNRSDEYYSRSKWKGTMALDGGPLFTQFSHFIDIMYWVFGDIHDIQAQFQNNNHKHNTEFEDSGNIIFKFKSGAEGAIQYTSSVHQQNFESSMTVIGEKGTIKIGGQYMDEVEFCSIESYEMPELEPTLPPNDYGAYKGSAANHHFLIKNVIDVLLHNQPITTNGFEGLKVVDIIERIYSLRKGKQI